MGFSSLLTEAKVPFMERIENLSTTPVEDGDRQRDKGDHHDGRRDAERPQSGQPADQNITSQRMNWPISTSVNSTTTDRTAVSAVVVPVRCSTPIMSRTVVLPDVESDRHDHLADQAHRDERQPRHVVVGDWCLQRYVTDQPDSEYAKPGSRCAEQPLTTPWNNGPRGSSDGVSETR